jgi:NAD(P)-dependent dehydrogenase (short-subunit alcohol dehydrogenase family)
MTQPSTTPDLSGRIALVTGASRGIGAAAATALARAGAHIVALARTQGALEELDDTIRAETGDSATLIPQDLNELDALDDLGPQLAGKFGRCDIFIGNAGILGTLTPVAHADPAELEKVMRINLHANQRLIRSLDPLLRDSDAGRAVFVTSGIGVDLHMAYWGEYAASKGALNALIKSYTEETRRTNLRVNLLNPGPVKTAMLARAFPGGAPMEDVKTPEDLAPVFLELCAPECKRNGAVVEH